MKNKHSNNPPESQLEIDGLRENNFKNINLSIPHDSIAVLCGPSGSGKSTLAFDTIYAEGGRRYIETFPPYTRQFLDRLKSPNCDHINNVRPALALEQRNRVSTSRSTVGTITEINDYLKVFWAHVSELECPECKIKVEKHSPENILKKLEKIKLDHVKNIYITFPFLIPKTANIDSISEVIQSQGFQRYLLPENPLEIKKIGELSSSKSAPKKIEVLVDRIIINKKDFDHALRTRILSSLTQAYSFSGKTLSLFIQDFKDETEKYNYHNSLTCSSCQTDYISATPSLFSFNSPIGACKNCQGFGKTLQIDISKCIPDHNKSIRDGAIACWEGPASSLEKKTLIAFCIDNDINIDSPWKNLSKTTQNLIFHGPDIKTKGKSRKVFRGILPWFDLLQGKRHKMHVRVFIARYRSEFICEVCDGSRLQQEASYFKVKGKTLYDFWLMALEDAEKFITEVNVKTEDEIVKNELISRLKYLCNVGLPYLTLDRQTKSLSGGEFQRVNLTSLLGANLTNTTLVLDEPTIGLHSRDTSRLIDSMEILKQRGNSLIVVEHDPEVISSADNVYEIGPAAGSHGGELVYEGPPEGLYNQETKTGQYFKNYKNNFTVQNEIKFKKESFIKIKNASANNLKNINVSIPEKQFTVLSGVSGSGKSSLLHECLYLPSKNKDFSKTISDTNSSISGLKNFNEIILVDQQPIGKSSRANPATYTSAWDVFRDYLAETKSAEDLGLSKSSFSFNVDGGRCNTCKGNGTIKVEMQFLTDVHIECESCRGQRFQDQVLTVRLGNKNVLEWLNTTVNDVFSYIDELPDEKKNKKIKSCLQPLMDLGLGYLLLGHPLNSLSGGEAQRLKLASFLNNNKMKSSFIILDEPTTGLHPCDIQLLIKCIRKLISNGHTVICIEHNLDVIKSCDWLIELGPEGGENGGYLLAEGQPSKLSEDKDLSTPTLNALREDNPGKTIKSRSKVSKASHTIERDFIKIKGARENNLKNIDVSIPYNKLSVVSGVSGSGKSTLAFDILFSEGQRRFIDCLSPYARQYIKQGARPDVDLLTGMPPTISVSQKTSAPHGISTLGTITEVYQYLRLLFSKVGAQKCVKDGEVISEFSSEQLVDEIINRYKGKIVFIFSPVVSGRKGFYNDLFIRALKAEINQARIDDIFKSFDETTRLERHKLHWISLLTGSIKANTQNKELLKHAVSQALVLSGGNVEISVSDPNDKPEVFSTSRVCPKCKTGYMPLDPQDFSFRSLRGMCNSCQGRGFLESHNRVRKVCHECNGSRLGPVARNVSIFGKTIHEISSLRADGIIEFFKNNNFPERLNPVADPLLKEMIGILDIINEIGLGYLSLDRDASTLSGGEAQRLRLAKSLGAPLTGVCYVLDEPSIGLHAKDHSHLMKLLYKIRDNGNTLVVVEHDEDTIREADHIIDIGPVGGSQGGHLVHSGSLKKLLKNKDSVTAQSLNQRSGVKLSKQSFKETKFKNFLKIEGARANTLKNISVNFPHKALSVVAGVSGAGKSSLVHESLFPAILEEFEGEKERLELFDKTWSGISGIGDINRLIEIDQTPIGKTSTSTPASFLGVFNLIRDIFAALPEAKIRGFKPSYFSYNTGDGRCRTCEGKGYITIPMSFMPDAKTLCDACNGLRYCNEALNVKLKGHSLGEILKMTISDAAELFSSYPRVKKALEYPLMLGIGYITLGQPSHTLSGGEAQRLKISKELSTREAKNTLYILDEPTIGLHMSDVEKLLNVLKLLVSNDNMVIVIEHNLDVILNADYLVEVGPQAGDKGGELLFQGTLNSFLKSRKKTPTLDEIKKYLNSRY